MLLGALCHCGGGLRRYHSPTDATVDLPRGDAIGDAPLETTDANGDQGPLAEPPQLDILFIIDNTPGMVAYQQQLTAALPELLNKLRLPAFGREGATCTNADTSGCALPDVHLGVVSTDVAAEPRQVDNCGNGGDAGRLQNQPRPAGTSCLAPQERFISYRFDKKTNLPIDATADPIEAIGTAFACIAPLGEAGCIFPRPLDALRSALTSGTNLGFWRQNALVVIVILSNKDDCSALERVIYDPNPQTVDKYGPATPFRCFEYGIWCDESGRDAGPRTNCRLSVSTSLERVSTYTALLSSFVAKERTFLALIAGPPQPVAVEITAGLPQLAPSCRTGAGDSAQPSIRLHAFGDSFGEQAVVQGVCQANAIRNALEALGNKIRSRLLAQ